MAQDKEELNNAHESLPPEGSRSKSRPKKKKRKLSEKEESGPQKKKRKLSEKEKTRRALKRLLTKIAVIVAVVIVVLAFIGGASVCHDNNMFPSVKDGDLAITSKIGKPYNGDIVVYEVNGDKKFGRVVGIAGDTIDFNDDGTYLINGTIPYETIYFATHPAPGSTIEFPYTVREGEVFIMNDMREDTNDSRMYGGITDIKGKVVLLLRRRGF